VMKSAKSSEFLDRLYKVSSERRESSERPESSEESSSSSSSEEEATQRMSSSKSKPKSTKTWVETSEIVGEYQSSDESEESESGISRSEITDINAHKKMILQILQKCTV
jgi:hypothetical protein